MMKSSSSLIQEESINSKDLSLLLTRSLAMENIGTRNASQGIQQCEFHQVLKDMDASGKTVSLVIAFLVLKSTLKRVMNAKDSNILAILILLCGCANRTQMLEKLNFSA
jgi:hypothetical protein